MTVYETDVPGVGKKYELDVGDGARLVVLIHHDGHREVYRRPAEDEDSEKLFELDAGTARTFGSILEGAHFNPVALEEIQVPLGESVIEWSTIEAGAPLVATSLADANIRQRTGVSILAVQRGEETHPNPEPDFELTEGDILVTIGTREEQDSLSALAVAESDEASGDADAAE
jgi:TrkA domain protein